jgi:hypothetical protein
LAAREQTSVELRPGLRRRPRGRAKAARRAAGFGAAGLGGFLARRPIGLALAAACLAAIAAGSYFISRSAPPIPAANQAGSEARKPSPSNSTMALAAGNARPDHRAVAGGSVIRHGEEPPPPAKNPAPSGSIPAQRDPALDRWFVKSYLRCWTPPAALPRGGDYAAQIRVLHNNDGSLAAAPTLVNPPTDPEWRDYADSAVRAVTKCNPLEVPPRYLPHFEQWRRMTLHFSPDRAVE